MEQEKRFAVIQVPDLNWPPVTDRMLEALPEPFHDSASLDSSINPWHD